MEAALGSLIVMIFVGLLLLLILRSLFLWYRKINLIVQKLDGILNELKVRNIPGNPTSEIENR